MIRERLALARSLPPGAVVRRAVGMATRRLSAAVARRRDLRRPTYCADPPAGDLAIVCDPIPVSRLRPHGSWITALAGRFMEHRFDLLGSGWRQVRHGMACAGVDGAVFPPGPAVAADAEGGWLSGRVNEANLPVSRAIWRLVDPGYAPVDWQLDFRSGYRWREDIWFGDVTFGRLDGVDVKVPWELARMQHLLVLAHAHALVAGSAAGAAGPPFARAFRNQILDFVATNPPRFGVNWRCPMDVAIRAANWVLAYGAFRAHGAIFDAAFEQRLKASLVDHGRHVLANLERYPEGRGNHYLADIAGLLFIAAGLPSSKETDRWLAFAAKEAESEFERQFNADGSNFEGSTCYHRLSLEMVAYATALTLGLPHVPARPGAGHARRLMRAAEFVMHVTKQSGRVAQIGDNDSGRFFVPHPVLRASGDDGAGPEQDHLDHRGTVAAVAALCPDEALARFGGEDRLDADLARALSRGAIFEVEPAPAAAAAVRVGGPAAPAVPPEVSQTIEIAVPDGGLRPGLALFGYPDFGLWIFRSDRLFLAIRCGPASGAGAGGSHAHNDQLAIELAVDGEDWIADPGSYLYCPPLARRNAWRSVRAHAAPQWSDREPGRLDVGPFRIVDLAQAKCLHFGEAGFVGEHRGYGAPVRRTVLLGDDAVAIHDSGLLPDPARQPVRCVGRDETRRRFAPGVPFSPGYGRLADIGR